MKVLMLTPSYAPIIGGVETIVENLTVNLNKVGVQADVLTFNMEKKWAPHLRYVLEEKNFKVYRISAFNPLMKDFYSLENILKLHVFPNPSFRRILYDYDILHFHDDVDLTLPLFSSFIRKPRIFHCTHYK